MRFCAVQTFQLGLRRKGILRNWRIYSVFLSMSILPLISRLAKLDFEVWFGTSREIVFTLLSCQRRFSEFQAILILQRFSLLGKLCDFKTCHFNSDLVNHSVLCSNMDHFRILKLKLRIFVRIFRLSFD